MDSDQLLRSIDTKLSAILAIAADAHLRTYGTARQQKARSLEMILTEAGLSARTTATILGKTERAVHLSLQAARRVEQPTSRAKKTPQVE